MKFKELKVGTSVGVPCLIVSITDAKARNGSAFCKLVLSDGESTVDANYWQRTKADLEKFLHKAVWLEVKTEEYQGNKSFIIEGIHDAPEQFKASDFLITAPVPSNEMARYIMESLSNECPGDCLNALTTKLFKENYSKISYYGGGKTVHNNYMGGLLYHTYRMMKSAVALTKVYETLDKGLLLNAVALHDIGKVKELETDELGISEYTTEGSLFGHILLGIEMIDRELYSSDAEIDAKRVMLLKHCIAASHGDPKFGAIKTPAVPEGMILHHLDMIDSRMDIFESAYKGAESGEFIDSTLYTLGARAYKA